MKNKLKYIFSILFRRGYGSNRWKSSFSSFGEGSTIAYPPLLLNPKGVSIGNRTTILQHVRIQNFYRNEEENPEIIIGDRCYLGFFLTILNASRVIIGNDVLFASHVLVSSENHGMDPESDIPYMDQPLESKPVIIGDGSWIGEKVCILPGVSIGKKCIIGAGSVVTKSIPDYSIAVGNPAKVIKQYNFKTKSWEVVL